MHGQVHPGPIHIIIIRLPQPVLTYTHPVANNVPVKPLAADHALLYVWPSLRYIHDFKYAC